MNRRSHDEMKSEGIVFQTSFSPATEEDIRILQDQAAQVHPGLFAAGKLRKKPAAHGVIDGEAICHLADGGIGVPASQSLEPGRKVAVAL